MVWSYGDNKINWYKPSDLQVVVNPRDFDPKHSILIDNVKKWVRQKSKIKLYESLMLDLKNMNPNPHLERERLLKQLKASHENNFKGKPQCSICGEYGGFLSVRGARTPSMTFASIPRYFWMRIKRMLTGR